MIPLRDTIPTRRVPVVTWTLIAVNLLAFLYELGLTPEGLERLFQTRGLVPARLAHLGRYGGLSTLVTSTFLHGGFFHLLSNMWTLWIFGDNVEDRMGPGRYLAFYLGCGVAAGAIHTLFDPTSVVPTIGASGAIAGVLGAYFMLFPLARVVTLVPIVIWPIFLDVPAYFFLGFWFLSQLLSGGLAIAGVASEAIAWWAHIGGFVAGVLAHRALLGRRAR